MNKVVTTILVLITLVVLVLILLLKLESLTDLETKPADSEMNTKNRVKESNKKKIYPPKQKKNHDSEDSSSLYSKLKANITSDDVIITGGYKSDNGNMRYSFIQLDKSEYDGKSMVKIRIQNIEISPETANDSNLDYLQTNNSRIFDHFGIETSEEHKKTEKRLNEKGMKVLTMPQLALQSGAEGHLYIGDDTALQHIDISVKSTILPDGSFDIELEAKQNRN